MRVAFAGASGTGKSTLAQWLSLELGLPMNPIGARSVAKDMGFVDPVSGESRPYLVDRADLAVYHALGGMDDAADPVVRRKAASLALERWTPDSPSCRPAFQDTLQKSKIAWENDNPSFVTDRTVCDNLSYEILHSLDTLTMEKFDRTYRAMRSYDFVFFCPMKVFCNPSGDSARVSDLAYHEAYECLLRGLMEKATVGAGYLPVWYLPVPGLRDRQDLIRTILSVPRSR